MRSYFEARKPRIMAHRGASAHFPENTMAAFEAAAPHVDHLELDVWSSKDGTIVVHHDESLKRRCGVDQAIHQLSWKELQQLDAGQGQRIPALAEVLERFPEHCFNMEIKQDAPGVSEKVVELLHAHKANRRTLVAAEWKPIIERVRSFDSEMATGLTHVETAELVHWLLAGAQTPFSTQARALQIPMEYPPHNLADPRLIHAVHALGLEVHYWLVNDAATLQKLLAMGADGVFTDDPALLAQTIPAIPQSERAANF